MTEEEYDLSRQEQDDDYQPSQDLVTDYEGLAEGVAEIPTHGESGAGQAGAQPKPDRGGTRTCTPHVQQKTPELGHFLKAKSSLTPR